MCGIVGVVGSSDPIAKIIEGLQKLEYRGYDSAGIALVEGGQFKTIKQEGKIAKLSAAVKKSKILTKTAEKKVAIGHTRWATHGRPSEVNAHPHASSEVCVVHNGIIENYQELREMLSKKGAKFLSETDSEVLPHLIEMNLAETGDIKKSIIKTCQGSSDLIASEPNSPSPEGRREGIAKRQLLHPATYFFISEYICGQYHLSPMLIDKRVLPGCDILS